MKFETKKSSNSLKPNFFIMDFGGVAEVSRFWTLVVGPGVLERARRLGSPPFFVSISILPI